MTLGTVRSPVNGHMIDQTGDTVFHPMSEHRLVISNILKRKGAFHLISKHREVACQTRDTVLHSMFKNTEI